MPSLAPRLRLLAVSLFLAGIFQNGLSAQEPLPQPDFAPVVKQMVEHSVLPGYQKLITAAMTQGRVLETLCQAPGPEQLQQTRDEFRNLVIAWSAVEMYRLGPAISDNRQERLFFWPDRRSRGLKQVEELISQQDPTALAVEDLRKKSVPTQGILALEYVLFGRGSENLATASADNFRCRYGVSITQAITRTADEIVAEWKNPDGFANLLYNTGPENPTYRNDAEAMQDFLRVISENLQSSRDMKLANALRENPAASKAKLAPFWRSNLTLVALQADLTSIRQLVEAGGLTKLAPRLTSSLDFEIDQASQVFVEQLKKPQSWSALTKDPASHKRLSYSLIPLAGAQNIVADLLPEYLGLSLGFNSLDGD
ncbi:imelysin family protein [Kiloniella laminariae]|uniref:Imelysin family protein n=1 Tax=Kiloniella laminariae TaxID=454162 RepID=A0ABT4LDT2_9PROT|nr:imelysin family protein [Kiloniella laminariae]MCZ4279257.1 imelysin family protein [Kiloniella laminariae]